MLHYFNHLKNDSVSNGSFAFKDDESRKIDYNRGEEVYFASNYVNASNLIKGGSTNEW